ncbi:MAG: UDP-glucose 4-epimerase GalE [Rhodospirillales bacterium]|nr:UDP-glucose 4-epimerase GalE [Rhodospirillales bacterium]
MKILVTGGAGYVGSHAVLALRARGADVVVLDNLRQGHAAAVPAGVRLIEGDIGDAALLDPLLGEGFDAVLHFAALSLVGESMQKPMLYLRANAAAGMVLIEACLRHQVGRFVLSSTANLFAGGDAPLDEAAAIDPGSPYGESKWMLERALTWAGRTRGLKSVALRYFNAAGADPDGRLGEDHDPETHLIPLAIDAALGRRPELAIFGTDYPTPDGTCIRDYVHVSDLAEAHVRALERLAAAPEGAALAYNLGTGHGHSVRAVLAAVGRVAGRAVPAQEAPRRAGDPAILVASAARFMAETGWAPRFGDLDTIVATAHAWRVAHPGGYGG